MCLCAYVVPALDQRVCSRAVSISAIESSIVAGGGGVRRRRPRRRADRRTDDEYESVGSCLECEVQFFSFQTEIRDGAQHSLNAAGKV